MTKDHDRKALIRARMEKTGESYTTARRQLFGENDAATRVTDAGLEPTGAPTTFSMPNDDATSLIRLSAQAKVEEMYARAGAKVQAGDLRVWMGEPSVFEASIPLASIRSVDRVPDREPGTSLGAHGSRGRWLVNSAYTGLVRMVMEPRAPARLTPRIALPDAVRGKGGLLMSVLLRDRTVKLKELTVSVDDPDALVAALRR